MDFIPVAVNTPAFKPASTLTTDSLHFQSFTHFSAHMTIPDRASAFLEALVSDTGVSGGETDIRPTARAAGQALNQGTGGPSRGALRLWISILVRLES